MIAALLFGAGAVLGVLAVLIARRSTDTARAADPHWPAPMHGPRSHVTRTRRDGGDDAA
jgi:hypothetical protein